MKKIIIWLLAATLSSQVFALDIKSNSHLLIEAGSGRVLLEKQADLKLPPASITKVMTAYIVFSRIKLGAIKLSDRVIISKKASIKGGSKMFIRAGSSVRIDDLLKGLIISSGNDAGIALAEYIAGTEKAFAQLMNRTAKKLGMQNSHFKNATGWPDDEHYSTARDLARLTQSMINNFPELYKIFSIKEFTYSKSLEGEPITQSNRNDLLWDSSLMVDGVKTGHTEAAGYCLVASAVKNEMRLISVVMKTASKVSRVLESRKLLKYGLIEFVTKKVLVNNKTILTVPVWKGEQESIEIGVDKDVLLTVYHDKVDQIKSKIQVNKHIVAPLKKGQKIGTVTFYVGDEKRITVPLNALTSVKSGGAFNNFIDSIMLFFYE